MAVTEDDRIRSTPRASKKPGSYEYARQMVYVLRTVWERARFDLMDWEKELAEARKNEIWRNHKPPYESLDELLASEVGFDADLLAEKCKAVKAERDNGQGLAKRGRPSKEEPRKGDNITLSVRGTSTEYTLRRLARDGHDELLDAIANEEISVNAAAIQVGYRKKKTPEELVIANFRKCEQRLEAVRGVLSALEPHERLIVIDWLKENQCTTS